MKYVVVVCLLTVATLAYVQASWVPVEEGIADTLWRDMQVHYDMMSRFRGSSIVLESINGAYRDVENPLNYLINAELRFADSSRKTCNATIQYQGSSLAYSGIYTDCRV